MDPAAASSDDESAQTVNPNSETPCPIDQCTNTNIDQSQQHQQLPQEQRPPSPHIAEMAPTSDAVDGSKKRKRSDGDSEESENGGPKSSQSQHFLWKTSLCSYFRREASCSHGDACKFAHGEEELRQRPDNTWDPTSERAKKLLKRTAESEEGDGVMMMTEFVAGDSSDPALRKCLVHLPMKWSSDNLKNFLDEQGISVKSSKKRKGMSVGFLSFENMEQVKNALEGLDGKSVGNKNLKVADVMPRSFEKKTTLVSENARVSTSSNAAEDGDIVVDCSVTDDSVPKGRSVRDVVTSLAHLPYADQLEQKKNSLAHTLKRLTRNARKACPNGASLPEWILKSREIGGLPCELVGILESPIVNGYRNKCEFSVGFSLEEKPTVGFMLGNFREGVTAVQEPLDCPNVSKISCKYTSIFQEFLQHSSLPIWNRFKNVGFWRQLTVREGRAPGKPAEVESVESRILEVMLIVQVCTVGFEDEHVNSELEKMAEAFATGASANSPSLPLTALVIQDHRGISNAAPPDAPLLLLSIPQSGVGVAGGVSEARIHDYISNLRFSISPTAFFQVNTLAAEKLYSLAGDWANLTPDTLLFDICCGTGTIGLTLAHRVGMVVGIEMNASAVSDAHRNAEINGIKNCKFICAKAEDVMGSLLKEYVNLPSKEDGLLSTSRSTSDKSATIEEKVVSMDNVTDPEESSCLRLENVNGTSTCLQILNDQQKVENQQGNISISEDGSHSVRQFKNVVAIVDPPRVGLHPTVIKVLRIHPSLRRLVYISCNPDSLVANAIELCTPSTDKAERANKNNKGWRNMSSAGLARHRTKSMPDSEPFQPVKAVAVDLFPHTPHCETVMLLER